MVLVQSRNVPRPTFDTVGFLVLMVVAHAYLLARRNIIVLLLCQKRSCDQRDPAEEYN
jgi:hypothetical protein